MCHPADSRGFALPMVLFVMVVAAMLVGTMARMTLVQRATQDLDLQALRTGLLLESATEALRYKWQKVPNAGVCAETLPAPETFVVTLDDCHADSQGLHAHIRAESAGGEARSPEYVMRERRMDIPRP